MLKIFVRKNSNYPWQPLYLRKVIQNEDGRFYGITRNGPYDKQRLARFDDHNPFFPFRKFEGGSHSTPSIKVQEALDFEVPEGWEFCINKVCTVNIRTSTDGSYIKVTAGKYEPFFVHTYDWVKKGTWKAMTPLGKIAPKSVTGFSPHLHIFSKRSGTKYRIRNDILAHQKEDTRPK